MTFTFARSARQSRKVSKSVSSASMNSERSLRWGKSMCIIASRGATEQHGFGGEAGTERHGAAARARRHVVTHQSLKYEQNGRRRHVAVIPQNRPRGRKRRSAEIECTFNGIEYRSAAGVHRPKINGTGTCARKDAIRAVTQSLGNGRRHPS